MVWGSFFWAAAYPIVIMIGLWFFYLKTDTPSIVDIGWSLAIGVLGMWYYLTQSEMTWFHTLSFVLLLYWSGRLSFLLLLRLQHGLKDKRYEKLSHHWKKAKTWKYCIFFLFQGIAAWLLSFPFWVIMQSNEALPLGIGIGFAWLVISLIGESWADWTLWQFRTSPHPRNAVCDKGLWKYSRHPNYFFEWNVWNGWALIASSVSSLGVLAWVCSFFMLLSILYLTGIPPTEEALLLSKGENYRKYMAKTSRFFPWISHK